MTVEEQKQFLKELDDILTESGSQSIEEIYSRLYIIFTLQKDGFMNLCAALAILLHERRENLKTDSFAE